MRVPPQTAPLPDVSNIRIEITNATKGGHSQRFKEMGDEMAAGQVDKKRGSRQSQAEKYWGHQYFLYLSDTQERAIISRAVNY